MQYAQRTLGLGLACLLVVATFVSAPPANAAPKALEGSWRALGTIDGTTDGSETLFTFSRGGTLVASSDNAGTSAGHGTWERLSGDTYAATNVAFLFDASGVATQVLETEITFEVGPSGDTFTATFQATIEALDGTALGTVTGTATGERIGS